MEEASTSARPQADVEAMLRSERSSLVCAPMVRYSKLAFRHLVRRYGADIAYTPMIVASSFGASRKAREAELSSDSADAPLVVQFAAANDAELARAAEYVLPHADGLDLNCGCPQRWAMQEGLGAKLIYKPETVAACVAAVRRLPHRSGLPFAVSVKIRLQDSDQATVELCRRAEAAGASFIAVHARTPTMKHEAIREEGLGLAKDAVGIPVLANGDVYTLQGGLALAERTGVDGVMSARGLLHNPALFSGAPATTLPCLKDWVELAMRTGLAGNFPIFHHHCMFMLDGHLSKAQKKVFNRLQSTPALLDYLSDNFGV